MTARIIKYCTLMNCYVSENLFKDVSLVELLVKKDGFGLMVVANEIIDECMVNKAEVYISLTLLY